MRNKNTIITLALVLGFNGLLHFGCSVKSSEKQIIKTVLELQKAVETVKPSDTLFIADGIYTDIKLVVNNSGIKDKPIVIRALNRGKVYFSGDVKVELRGEHIMLDGIYFKDGNRNPDEWYSHGPGLVTIYGSYNRVTQCAFHAFDKASTTYVCTFLPENGLAPQYCRIDHCSFTEKINFDQVINLNNKARKDLEDEIPGIPMYHRIDHCYFSNPKKPGNAGGGIRVGYRRIDYGRCLVDHNLFERQDSEPEIITSKSMENVYYHNTYKNCAGTMNFRHGDKQVAINNFHIGTDTLNEYGGMFVWGSNHIIANNYFNLPTTLKSRGNAALYLNVGTVATGHALAFNTKIINNIFDRDNGYAINFSALYERRVPWCAEKGYKLESPRDLYIVNNLFISEDNASYPLFYKHDTADRNITWENNIALNSKPGFDISEGISFKMAAIKKDAIAEYRSYTGSWTEINKADLYNIEGVDLDIPTLVAGGIQGKPITWKEVGTDWLDEIPGTYAKTGKLTEELQREFDEVVQTRKEK